MQKYKKVWKWKQKGGFFGLGYRKMHRQLRATAGGRMKKEGGKGIVFCCPLVPCPHTYGEKMINQLFFLRIDNPILLDGFVVGNFLALTELFQVLFVVALHAENSTLLLERFYIEGIG